MLNALRQWMPLYMTGLIEGMPESNFMVYAKEDLGVIVAKTSTPPIILAINETNLTAAFWDYLKDIFGEKVYQNPSNAGAAKRLKEYIQRIQNT